MRVKVQDELHTKEEITIMDSHTQEIVQHQVCKLAMSHCCETESMVPFAKKIRIDNDDLLQCQYCIVEKFGGGGEFGEFANHL